ncbi:unnamed protein product [Prorocentrum cordatum]|uniref:Uncharacterized protein n=1 Tax=Prorocentrum cordatum TaxID=2364126 RepID=A0ABN9Y1Q3_9DINO|nr:unnamed protein product [Polarella glacialis]
MGRCLLLIQSACFRAGSCASPARARGGARLAQRRWLRPGAAACLTWRHRPPGAARWPRRVPRGEQAFSSGAAGGMSTRTEGEATLRHPLLEKNDFERLRRNDVLELRPHILHFGGFSIHEEHSQVLRILNVSASSTNMKIIGPATQWFKITYEKKGLLAPGMSEDVTVTFTPHEWRYYYDTVKIFCGDQADNLIVPIHAYPAANDVTLPRIIDFGRVPIGATRTRTLPLTCKIPIMFEYEFTLIEEHPDIQVTPLSGTIPADGTVNVVVTFAPTRHRTARAELQFVVSQFDFEPVPLTVCGSCPPDLSRDAVITAARPAIEAALAEATALPEKHRPTEKRPARKDTAKTKPPTYRFEVAERDINGVKVPVAPMTQANTNFVLSQTVGKIPMKDLPLFIKSQREAVESRQRRAEERHAAGKEGDDASEDGEEDRQALELQFELAYREVEKKDKERELKSMAAARGEEELTQEDAERERAARRKREEKLKQNRLQRDVTRADTVLSKLVVAVPEGLRIEQAPRWDEGENDTELLRQQVTDRFVRAGSRCIARIRARRRCHLLREAMRAAGAVDRGSCRAWVEAESKSAAAGAGKGQDSAGGKAATALDTTAAGAVGEPVEQEKPGEPLDIVHIPSSGFVLPVQLPTPRQRISLTLIRMKTPRSQTIENSLWNNGFKLTVHDHHNLPRQQYSASGEMKGYWAHRDLIFWKQPREGSSRVWHFVFLNEYNHYLSRDEGKGCAKNKGNAKNIRPAPYAGTGKGGKSAAPHWTAGQKGGGVVLEFPPW